MVGDDLHSLVVDTNDPRRLFIGSHQGASVSSDGGRSWQVVSSLDGADAMGWAFTGDSVIVGGHPGISISTDDGETFVSANDGLPSTDIHALGAGGGVVYAASPGAGFMASIDGGKSWEVRNQQVGMGFMGKILVDPSDSEHVIGPDMQAGAVESTDGGREWHVLGGEGGAMWVSWDPKDVSNIIVTGAGSATRSADGGRSWEAVDTPSGTSIVEFSPDGRRLYAGVLDSPVAHLFMSSDGGKSWDPLADS